MISRKPPVTTSFIDKGFWVIRSQGKRWLLWFMVAFLLSGCAATPDYEIIHVPETEITAYLQDKPPELQYYYRKVLTEGRRNLVLNHLRAGLAAMDIGKYDLAEQSFDTALLNIEAVFADDPNAEKARSLWHSEGRKDFKGEPYERAMAYYYRGLLYMRKGDFENARASFKGGLLQDALAEDEVYRADFALLIFLEGWASLMLGDDDMAEEAFAEVKKFRADFVPPDFGDNVLLIAETGTAPQKIATGKGQSELRFTPGTGFREEKAAVEIGGSVFNGYPMEDIYWQASTRGGREVDKILEGKAQFKGFNETMGQTLTGISAQALSNVGRYGDDAAAVAIVAGIVGLLGLGQQAMADRTRAEADIRQWDNLPDKIHVFTFNSNEQNSQAVPVSFLEPGDKPVANLNRKTNINFINDRFGFAWVRSRSTMGN